MDLLNELNEKCRCLDSKVSDLKEKGRNYAKAQKDYKVKLSQESMKLKDSKMPVTLIDKVCYGLEEVAELREKRDCAEVLYKATLESINILKLQIRILQAQIEREWGLAKN